MHGVHQVAVGKKNPTRAASFSIASSVSRSASFEEQSTTLTELFKAWHTDKVFRALRELYCGTAQVLLLPSRPSGHPRSSPSSIMHSNLGVMDQFINRT